jgi:hypothetical protein
VDALGGQTVGFFEESFRIDHHAVAQHARLAFVHDAGWQKMKDERLITDLH